MKQKLATRRMRQHPDLEQLKRQSKELLAAFRAADVAAVSGRLGFDMKNSNLP